VAIKGHGGLRTGQEVGPSVRLQDIAEVMEGCQRVNEEILLNPYAITMEIFRKGHGWLLKRNTRSDVRL